MLPVLRLSGLGQSRTPASGQSLILVSVATIEDVQTTKIKWWNSVGE